MPEVLTINRETIDTAPVWAAYTALAGLGEEEKTNFPKTPGEMTVSLTINGVEVPFTRLIKRLKEEASRWADERAKEILEERAGSINEMLYKLQRLADKVELEVMEEVKKILPNVCRD